MLFCKKFRSKQAKLCETTHQIDSLPKTFQIPKYKCESKLDENRKNSPLNLHNIKMQVPRLAQEASTLQLSVNEEGN